MLNLDRNLKISIQSGKKLQKYCEKNVSLEYLSKMSYLLPKNLLRVSENPEILHTTKLTRAQKKTSKLLFSPGPSTWRKWDLKYINICCLFSSIYKYLVCLSESSVQLVPTILQFYSHHACKLLKTNCELVWWKQSRSWTKVKVVKWC